MPDLAEIDRALTSNPRQAHRHLQLLTPYAYDEPYPSEAIDDRPISHPSFTFAIKTDVEGRDDHPVRLTGTLEALKDTLHAANTAARNGIWVELDPAVSVLAQSHLQPHALDRALSVAPSVTVAAGRTADGWHCLQWIWLLSEPATPAQRETITKVLRNAYGAHVPDGKPLMRLAGFFSRFAEPQLVSATGSAENQGQVAVRHDPAELARTLALVSGRA
jgi:hypothetical protein